MGILAHSFWLVLDHFEISTTRRLTNECSRKFDPVLPAGYGSPRRQVSFRSLQTLGGTDRLIQFGVASGVELSIGSLATLGRLDAVVLTDGTKIRGVLILKIG